MNENPFPLDQSVLIVDDNPNNIRVLADYLETHGFKILVARDGESGINKAIYAQPSLILLDVMMPDIDGFETCRRLKANSTTQHIPVIFMTALTDVEDKVRGFAAGAVDYVTKPLQQEEVLARVSTHLKIQALTESLQQANARLMQMNVEKDKFFSILAHDLRGPFLPLLGSAELLYRRSRQLTPERVADMGEAIYQSGQRIMDLLENLLRWGQMQIGRVEFQPTALNVAELIKQNFDLLAANAKTKQIELLCTSITPMLVFADSHMLNFVLRNLITNAIKFTQPEGQIRVSWEAVEAGFVTMQVQDNGVGMTEKVLQSLFRMDMRHTSRGTANETGTGLGLLLCQEMVTRNGGRIWIKSREGKGTAVSFTIPSYTASSPVADSTS